MQRSFKRRSIVGEDHSLDVESEQHRRVAKPVNTLLQVKTTRHTYFVYVLAEC